MHVLILSNFVSVFFFREGIVKSIQPHLNFVHHVFSLFRLRWVLFFIFRLHFIYFI